MNEVLSARRRRVVERVRPPYARSARLYDVLFGRPMLGLFARNFDTLTRRYGIRAGSAADVGCGTGDFVRYLIGRGIRAVGVDASRAMIREARRRMPGARAIFFVQDLRELRLPFRVDVITCNFDVMNYCLSVADLLQAFCSFRRNVRENGWLIFDMIVGDGLPAQSRRQKMVFVARNLVSRWIISWHPGERIRKVVMLHTVGPHGRVKEREVHVQRAYPVGTIVQILRSAGFMVAGVHGAGRLGPRTNWDTRVVFVARRRPDPEGAR